MSSSDHERAQLKADVAAMFDAHWMSDGYTVPNRVVYPWQWLWDSCFHAIVWAGLGDTDRAQQELASALAAQDESGFVPHMNYHSLPDVHASFWGRRHTSSITQPPMFGHAVAVLAARNVALDRDLLERARRGIWFLLRHRARDLDSGLVAIVHPWETGADDSPRWDDLCPGGFRADRWREHKGDLVGAIVRSSHGAPIANGRCAIAPAGFNALVAFNACELAPIVADDAMAVAADELVTRLDRRWDAVRRTWTDAGVTGEGSGRIRTLDGLLPALVTHDVAARAAALASLVEPGAYGAPFGPAGVHRAEDSFSPSQYWRGPAWPQLSYLLWIAAKRARRVEAAQIAATTVDAARVSGLAEYWHPDTGEGFGAVPQSWTGLALVMAGEH